MAANSDRIYLLLQSLRTNAQPYYSSFKTNYAEPFKLPIDQLTTMIDKKVKDPYFYAYALLGVCAWYHTMPFIGATLTGLFLTGGWDYIQDNYTSLVQSAAAVVPLPLKNSLLPIDKQPNQPAPVKSFFEGRVDQVQSQSSTDSKIIAIAALLFMAWFTSYSALFGGLMFGNYIWHQANDSMAKFTPEQLPHVQNIMQTPDANTANSYYQLAMTLKNGETVDIPLKQVFTKQQLLIEAAKLEEKSEYFTELATTMSSEGSVTVNTSMTKKQILEKAHSLT